jgi:hypothetical protein
MIIKVDINSVNLDELKEVLKSYFNSDFDSDRQYHKKSILLLLKEFARRLLLWKIEIERKGITVHNRVLFDVALMITGNRIDESPIRQLFPENEKLELMFSKYDNLLFMFYVNWLIHKEEIERLGYVLPAPYEPFLEVIKRGGNGLTPEFNRFEIYPYIGISLNNLEEYMTDIPFYKDIAHLDLVDERSEDES